MFLTRRTLLTCALCAAPLFACRSGGGSEREAAAPPSLTIDEVSAKITDAAAGKVALAIYDNNAQETYAKGHLPGAKWVDHKSVKAADLPADKSTTLVFYCANEK